MSRKVDLLVVGGGPAGSTLAALAAAAGARTLLIERARFPRDKVCGEFVSAEGCSVLGRLGVLEELRSAGAASMRACRITEPRGARLDLDLPHLEPFGSEALGVSRARLDTVLLENAARCGADIHQGREASSPVIENGRTAGVRLRGQRRGPSDEVRAAQVVAADGRRSALGRALHPRLGDPRRSRPRSWFGLKAHFAGVDRLADRVELHLFDGGYAGLAPIENGRVNLCLMLTVEALRRCAGKPDRLLAERARRNHWLSDALGDAKRCSSWTSVGPLRFGMRRAAAAGVLFVGDAAGTIDPFCGEGMTNALIGAELALPFALQAVAHGGLTDTAARAYDRCWRSAFAPVTRRVRMLGRLFERPRLARPLLLLLAGAGRSVVPRIAAATRTGSPA